MPFVVYGVDGRDMLIVIAVETGAKYTMWQDPNVNNIVCASTFYSESAQATLCLVHDFTYSSLVFVRLEVTCLRGTGSIPGYPILDYRLGLHSIFNSEVFTVID